MLIHGGGNMLIHGGGNMLIHGGVVRPLLLIHGGGGMRPVKSQPNIESVLDPNLESVGSALRSRRSRRKHACAQTGTWA